MNGNEVGVEVGVIEGEMVEEVKPLSPRQEYVKNLRAMADFFESQEAVPIPSINTRIDLFSLLPNEVPAIAKAFGSSKKEYIGDSFFVLKRKFGDLLSVEANWNREKVCTRVVVGQKTVARQVPVAYETKNEVVDVVEWKCTDPVLAPRTVTPALSDGTAPSSPDSNDEVPF
jgi:hypothetical protein